MFDFKDTDKTAETTQLTLSTTAVICAVALLVITFCAPVTADPPASGDWQLVWSDEFDSGSTPTPPDSDNWGYESGYVRNKEWQYYTSDIQNAYCQDGFLHIEAHEHPPGTYPTGSYTGQDGSISSACLISRNKVEYQYGWLEMCGRIDTQYGSWPAFWTCGINGEWPDNGECDIMEYYKNKLLFNVAWWKTGDARWTARWDSVTVQISSLPPTWPDEFHVWAMEWAPDYVKLYMDDVLYNTWDSAQDDNGGGDTSVEGFQQPHFIRLNQAIGGTAGGDASNVVYPTNYEVDYVRWYQNANPPEYPTIVDDDDASITYDGTWGTWSGNPGYMETEHYSETADSTATFSFTGTKARYYGFKREDLGHAEIFLDGDLVDTIDCYSSSSQYFVNLYESPYLTYGNHTLAVKVKGTKNSSSSGTEIIVDAFGYFIESDEKASNPDPANDAPNVPIAAELTWTAGQGATAHDVYFGTADPPTFVTSQTACTYQPPLMDGTTTYYWKIDEINSGGTTDGDLWTFTTRIPGDVNADGSVNLADVQQFCDGWLMPEPEPDVDINGDGLVDFLDYAYLTESW